MAGIAGKGQPRTRLRDHWARGGAVQQRGATFDISRLGPRPSSRFTGTQCLLRRIIVFDCRGNPGQQRFEPIKIDLVGVRFDYSLSKYVLAVTAR